jgi:hypothetical protein
VLKLCFPTIKGKGKAVPVLFFYTEHHVMKSYWGSGVWLHAFLTSALGGREWSASRPGRFTPRERAPGTHWIGGWVAPRAVLGAVMRKIPSPCRESNPRTPDRSARSLVTTPTEPSQVISCSNEIFVYHSVKVRSFNKTVITTSRPSTLWVSLSSSVPWIHPLPWCN